MERAAESELNTMVSMKNDKLMNYISFKTE